MVFVNKSMATKLALINQSAVLLSPALLALLQPGFVEVDGCFFLKTLALAETNVSTQNFPDKTGYECFINSIHIDDYVQGDFLDYSILFAEKAFEIWRSSGCPGEILAIVTCDEFGASVKIHQKRSGESWLGSNLEAYEDAVLLADSATIKLR